MATGMEGAVPLLWLWVQVSRQSDPWDTINFSLEHKAGGMASSWEAQQLPKHTGSFVTYSQVTYSRAKVCEGHLLIEVAASISHQ